MFRRLCIWWFGLRDTCPSLKFTTGIDSEGLRVCSLIDVLIKQSDPDYVELTQDDYRKFKIFMNAHCGETCSRHRREGIALMYRGYPVVPS